MDLFNLPISYNKAKLVKSISTNQDEILRGIMQLYLPDGFECDVCYNIGSFYKSIPQPKFKFDLTPLTPVTIQADCRNLPLPDVSIKSLVYDPPFVIGTHIESDPYLMHNRYTAFKSRIEQKKFYIDSIKEFSRVIIPGGFLVIKIQDVVSGRKKLFNSHLMRIQAEQHGFNQLDEFILIANNRFIGNIQNQFHARSYHSFFMVFKKTLK